MDVKTKFNIGNTVSMIDWNGKIASFVIDSIIIKNDNTIYYCDEELLFEISEEDLFNNIKEKKQNQNVASTPTKEELYNAGIDVKNHEKLKIAVICDNKEDFVSYIRSHNNEKYEYIYVSENSYPQGIEFDDVIDLRIVTLTIITRMKSEWLKSHNWFKGEEDVKN